ncbi:MAG: hypothetical protein QOI88_1850, partial [Gammaproteobacteria bacterium]|nr:hypothetical protein [Gammaproteobacteria bacterium]
DAERMGEPAMARREKRRGLKAGGKPRDDKKSGSKSHGGKPRGVKPPGSKPYRGKQR